MRWFNTAGPCKPEVHYTLSATSRLPEVRALVDRMAYFVVHAPRQTGKTTGFMNLAAELTSEGRYCSALLSLEVGAWAGDDPGAAEAAILAAWRADAEAVLPTALRPPPWPDAPAGYRLSAALAAWARASPRPLALFLDEVDALRDEALLSALRQLRSGFKNRPAAFPWSVALIGLRDVRDYLIASGSAGRVGSSSPFNIKTASVTMRSFTVAEVAELLGQHTAETGQVFCDAAVGRVFELSRGQPWLVNALAAECVDRLVPDQAVAVEVRDVDRARDVLIARQDTHLDSLAERLREPRVRAVVEPVLSGGRLPDLPRDDLQYVLDLGLLVEGEGGGIEPANPIYKAVITRDLATNIRASLPRTEPVWLGPDGELDQGRLLDAFLAFWRRHGEALLGSAPYHEIAPHLVLMAFLDRVANGGGRVEREYAIGKGSMDLLLELKGVRVAIEVKVWRPDQPDPVPDGLAQLDGYLDGLGLDEGWLIVFDRRPGRGPARDRTTTEAVTSPAGRATTLIRA